MPLIVNDTNETDDLDKPEPQPITHAPKADYSMLKSIVVITAVLGIIATVIFVLVSSSFRVENSSSLPNTAGKQIIDEKSVQPQIKQDTLIAVPRERVSAEIESPVRREVKPNRKIAGRYTIILGTYKIEQNADKEITRLRNSGYEAWIISDDKYYRVAIGKYNDEVSARLGAKRMKILLKNGYMIKLVE